jgi:hypothetical protein
MQASYQLKAQLASLQAAAGAREEALESPVGSAIALVMLICVLFVFSLCCSLGSA